MPLDIKTLPKFARGALNSIRIIGWDDSDPDAIGIVFYDDLVAGVAGSVVENEAGSTYTLVSADEFKYKRFTEAGGCEVTVPAGVFEVNDIITLHTVEAGSTLVPDVGVTFNVPGGGAQPYNFQEAHATVQIKQVATDEWDVIGGIEGTI